MTYTEALQLVAVGQAINTAALCAATAWLNRRADHRAQMALEAEERRLEIIRTRIDLALRPSDMHEAARSISQAAAVLDDIGRQFGFLDDGK